MLSNNISFSSLYIKPEETKHLDLLTQTKEERQAAAHAFSMISTVTNVDKIDVFLKTEQPDEKSDTATLKIVDKDNKTLFESLFSLVKGNNESNFKDFETQFIHKYNSIQANSARRKEINQFLDSLY